MQTSEDKIKDQAKESEYAIKNDPYLGHPNSIYLKRNVLTAIIIGVLVISSIFGALFGALSAGAINLFSDQLGQRFESLFPGQKTTSTDQKINKQQVIVEDSAVIDVVEKSSPAVVSISISKNVPTSRNPLNNPGSFFDPFFGGLGSNSNSQAPSDNKNQKQTIGGGSGFFITSDGLILTNRHVVEDQQADYTVITNDKKEYKATILARDPVRDVAVIKVEGSNFPVLPLGDSDQLKIGQTAIAIGNSLGEFSNSVSRGIVSGLKRNVSAGSGLGETERLTDIIQTDAAINPGNSGGPLIDINGNVVGLNVAMAQGAQNIGFALPVNQVKRIIDQVENGVKVSVPYLGVRYVMVDQDIQKQAQLPFDYGVLVLRGTNMTDFAVIPGSPADMAGIVENDVILEVNDQKITQDNQLGDIIAKYNVGDKITLKVWHKGQTRDLEATLQERKQ